MSKKDDLLYGLNRTQAEEVHVQYDQVVEVLGEERAAELALQKTTLQEGPREGRNLVQAVQNLKIQRNNRIATFDRKALVDALNSPSQETSYGDPED